MNPLLIAGISQGLILSFLLIYKSITRKNNAWLIALFILVLTLIISGPFLNQALGAPLGSFLVDPQLLLLGPLLYLYIQSFLRRLEFKDLLRHLPVVLLYIPVLVSFYYTSFRSTTDGQVDLHQVYASGFAVGLGVFKFCQLGFYFVISYKALRKHRRKIRELFSNPEGKDLLWLDHMIYAFIFLVLVSFALYLAALQQPELQDRLTLINLLLLSTFILSLTFFAFNQNRLLEHSGIPSEETEDRPGKKDISPPRYEKSGLKESEVSDIKEQVMKFLERKAFLDPELSLTSMAASLNVHPNRLSEVLSKYLNTCFYDLINSHRIEEIRHAIDSGKYDHWTLLAIAFEHGYNSKSTFNAAFKKYTGMTPSQYKRLESRGSGA